MTRHISNRQMTILLLCGIIGCVLMGGGDWLMIYGDPFYEGKLAWLTRGVAEMASWRTSAAMAMAFPAVVFYCIGLFSVRHFLQDRRSKRNYSALTCVGMMPWLCLHLFYVMILYAFSWLSSNGFAEAAHPLGEALFAQFSWIVLLAEGIMLLPFFYLFYLLATGKSRFPRWLAVNNPLVIFLILKGITLLLPESAARLAWINGLMSESMIIWFTAFIISLWYFQKRA